MSIRVASSDLPTGTVTFMFTDIEGSTRYVQTLDSEAFSRVISRHNELTREILERENGVEVSTEGDAFFAVFEDPERAIATALGIQRAMSLESWPNQIELRVRIGLHTGAGVLGGDNYVGVDVHRASRIAHAAHGGQVVLSRNTVKQVGDALPKDVTLLELGTVKLAGFREPESIFQLVSDGLASEFPPLRGVAPVSHLPDQLTAFIGREEELELGERLLGDSRLLTLTGPGGSGKTRLSIELARCLEPRFDDGAHFVSLASITDAALMPTTVLEGLGLNTAPNVDPMTHLHQYLAGKDLLLILDNLEQLSRSGASFVAEILQNARRAKLIATSRSPLRITGEREIPVPPLPVPKDTHEPGAVAEFAGIRLFVDRATAVNPGFELNSGNVETVLSLTRRLDGLPLALELAASQMRTFTPELILERIDNRLLATRSPDVPERQQTIMNTIGWSYDLLDEEARRVFERCSVFSGTFGLSEAERIIGGDPPETDVLEGITALVENSLIQPANPSGDPRYRMLVVIKEYAYAALAARGDTGRLERLHAEVYTDLAEKASEEILTSRQRYWLDRLAVDHDNLRAAFDWGIRNHEASIAMRLVASLWRFWQIRGHLPEARQKAELAVSMDGGVPRERAKALLALGGVKYWQGHWGDTLEQIREAVDLLREHGTEAEVADAAYNLAFPTGYTGDHQEAERLLLESLEISERLGDRAGIGRAYWGLGDIAAYHEEWSRELEMMLKATEELEGVDAPFDLGWAHFMTAYGYQHRDEDDQAREELLRALNIFADVSDLSAMTLIFEGLGLNSLRSGDLVRAARLAGAAQRLKTDTGVAITAVSVSRYEEYEQLLKSDDEAIQAAYEEGLEMSLEEMLSLARA